VGENMNITLADTISAGIHNPDCAFFVGHMTGSYGAVSNLFCLLALFLVYKLIDKLAWTPLLDWIKLKIYKKK